MAVSSPTKPRFLRHYGGGSGSALAGQESYVCSPWEREREEADAAFEARQFAAPISLPDDGLDRYDPADCACAGDPDPGRYDLEGRVY